MAKSETVRTKLDENDYAELNEWAEEERRPMAQLLRVIVLDALMERRTARTAEVLGEARSL